MCEPLQVPAQTGPPLQAAQRAGFGVGIVAAAAQLGSLPIFILGDQSGAQARLDVSRYSVAERDPLRCGSRRSVRHRAGRQSPTGGHGSRMRVASTFGIRPCPAA